MGWRRMRCCWLVLPSAVPPSRARRTPRAPLTPPFGPAAAAAAFAAATDPFALAAWEEEEAEAVAAAVISVWLTLLPRSAASNSSETALSTRTLSANWCNTCTTFDRKSFMCALPCAAERSAPPDAEADE